jgi:hypothetical protein
LVTTFNPRPPRESRASTQIGVADSSSLLADPDRVDLVRWPASSACNART